MIITIHDDLSSTVTSDDGTLECHFPAYNVETMAPLTSREEAQQQAERVRGQEAKYLSPVTQPATTGNLQPTAPEFMLLLTIQERVAIRAARESDAIVEDIMAMFEDSRLTFVDLSKPSVIEAIRYFASTDPAILTSARVDRILSGLDPE
ncbi:hypothetical protein VPH49_22030 [Pseudomonas luteola]|uniref:hypothetical protein n=1 Tax=Pseudomonas luteola TaxID=47886 RepID=UPI003A8A4F21